MRARRRVAAALLGLLVAAAAAATPRPAVALPPPQPEPAATPRPTQPVDWPDLPDPSELEARRTTQYGVVYAASDDALLREAVDRWAPHVDPLVTLLSSRLQREVPWVPVRVMFARAYPAACPARGIAYRDDDGAVAAVFVGEDTSADQVRAVLAHELTHALTFNDSFVGDGVLTEGVANWAPGRIVLRWQGVSSWPEEARARLADGTYVSVADPAGLAPDVGEDCIARRDKVYNIRAGFTEWLVDRVGVETVLAMPPRRFRVAGEGSREPYDEVEPDYSAATGFTLEQLETIWLAELTSET